MTVHRRGDRMPTNRWLCTEEATGHAPKRWLTVRRKVANYAPGGN